MFSGVKHREIPGNYAGRSTELRSFSVSRKNYWPSKSPEMTADWQKEVNLKKGGPGRGRYSPHKYSPSKNPDGSPSTSWSYSQSETGEPWCILLLLPVSRSPGDRRPRLTGYRDRYGAGEGNRSGYERETCGNVWAGALRLLRFQFWYG